MKKVFLLLPILVLIACSRSAEKTETTARKDSTNVVTTTTIPMDPGVIGVYDIPEMLGLCKKDSASGKDISFKLAKTYSVLEEELKNCGAEMGGSPGALYYSNDPANFVFEGVLPLKRMPEKTPKNCQLVVLERSKMVVYNHYGSYNSLFKAYAVLKEYLSTNKLEQSGTAREFYITDPTLEPDSAKWLSRVFIPVK